MKIISKFKDFYDFEMVKYGVDEKLIYHRKTSVYTHEPSENYEIRRDSGGRNHIILLIGNKTIHLFKHENKIYTHFDLKDPKILGKNRFFWHGMAYFRERTKLEFKNGAKFDLITEFGTLLEEMMSADREKMLHYLSERFGYYRDSTIILDDTCSQVFLNEPIVLVEYLHSVLDFSSRKYHKIFRFTYNPNLSQMGIYIDGEFVWQSLVEFLSKKRSEKEIMPQMSDVAKIQAKGFDVKTSFRPKMKKK